jgi:hypothetical protein
VDNLEPTASVRTVFQKDFCSGARRRLNSIR